MRFWYQIIQLPIGAVNWPDGLSGDQQEAIFKDILDTLGLNLVVTPYEGYNYYTLRGIQIENIMLLPLEQREQICTHAPDGELSAIAHVPIQSELFARAESERSDSLNTKDKCGGGTE